MFVCLFVCLSGFLLTVLEYVGLADDNDFLILLESFDTMKLFFFFFFPFFLKKLWATVVGVRAALCGGMGTLGKFCHGWIDGWSSRRMLSPSRFSERGLETVMRSGPIFSLARRHYSSFSALCLVLHRCRSCFVSR